MGIRYRKISDQDNAVLIENPYFVQKRKTFCQLIDQFESEGRPILYSDESYIHVNDQPSKMLVDTNITCAADKEQNDFCSPNWKSGRGVRLLIMHMVGPDGL